MQGGKSGAGDGELRRDRTTFFYSSSDHQKQDSHLQLDQDSICQFLGQQHFLNVSDFLQSAR